MRTPLIITTESRILETANTFLCRLSIARALTQLRAGLPNGSADAHNVPGGITAIGIGLTDAKFTKNIGAAWGKGLDTTVSLKLALAGIRTTCGSLQSTLLRPRFGATSRVLFAYTGLTRFIGTSGAPIGQTAPAIAGAAVFLARNAILRHRTLSIAA